jgi:hypothetical protein
MPAAATGTAHPGRRIRLRRKWRTIRLWAGRRRARLWAGRRRVRLSAGRGRIRRRPGPVQLGPQAGNLGAQLRDVVGEPGEDPAEDLVGVVEDLERR